MRSIKTANKKKMAVGLKSCASFALDLLYPPCCPFCAEILKSGIACKACLQKLAKIEEPCKFCGAEKKECTCGGKIQNYSRLVAPFYYDGEIKDAITRYKLDLQMGHHKLFARCIADEVLIRCSEIHFDFCTAVPTSKRTISARGFDHTDILAREVASILEIPYENLLEKTVENKPQKELSAEERRKNVLGAYKTKGGYLGDKNILLIDDLKTTGATLGECSKILLLAKANSVIAAVLCIAQEDQI